MSKTVLITGSSKGVGEATGKLFAQKGWNVAATARDPARLGPWAMAANVAAFTLDVTDPASVKAAVTEAEHRFGRIDVLVNNAGGGLGGPVEYVTLDQFERLMDLNFLGVVNTMQAVLPGMRQRRSGVIVNVSSVTGRLGIPFLAPYCASKHAVEGLSEAMTYELEPFGIRLKLIEPGGVKGEFSHDWTVDEEAYLPDSRRIQNMMKAGVKVASGPEGVAEAIYKAATDGKARLRYTANGGGVLLRLHRFLSPSAFHRLMQKQFFGKR